MTLYPQVVATEASWPQPIEMVYQLLGGGDASVIAPNTRLRSVVFMNPSSRVHLSAPEPNREYGSYREYRQPGSGFNEDEKKVSGGFGRSTAGGREEERLAVDGQPVMRSNAENPRQIAGRENGCRRAASDCTALVQ